MSFPTCAKSFFDYCKANEIVQVDLKFCDIFGSVAAL